METVKEECGQFRREHVHKAKRHSTFYEANHSRQKYQKHRPHYERERMLEKPYYVKLLVFTTNEREYTGEGVLAHIIPKDRVVGIRSPEHIDYREESDGDVLGHEFEHYIDKNASEMTVRRRTRDKSRAYLRSQVPYERR